MKIKKYFIFFLLLICGLAISITGCKTKKGIAATREISDAKEVFSVAVNNSLEYNTFSGKIKTTLRMGKMNVDISAQLKIIKDDRLMLSFQMPLLGELYRLGISNDSLILIDRMNKQFVLESIQDIQRNASFDFNVYNLQSLFTNQLFLSGKSRITEKDFPLFEIEQSSKQAIIRTKEKHQQIDYSFTVDYSNHITNSTMDGNNGKTVLDWAYGNFSMLENKQLFPTQMNINLNHKGTNFSMNFTFSKIDLDKDFEIDFGIPQKYTRVTLEQALVFIKNIQ